MFTVIVPYCCYQKVNTIDKNFKAAAIPVYQSPVSLSPIK